MECCCHTVLECKTPDGRCYAMLRKLLLFYGCAIWICTECVHSVSAAVTYQRLAFLLAEKHAQSYSRNISWICCLLNLSLLRSAITCFKGGGHSTTDLACQTINLSEGPLGLVVREGPHFFSKLTMLTLSERHC